MTAVIFNVSFCNVIFHDLGRVSFRLVSIFSFGGTLVNYITVMKKEGLGTLSREYGKEKTQNRRGRRFLAIHFACFFFPFWMYW